MKIPKGKLKYNGESGDGKRAFIRHTGSETLGIEIDTDDVNHDEVKPMIKELIRRWNSFEK